MNDEITNDKNQEIIIVHADSLEDAELLKKQHAKKLAVKTC